MKIKICVQVWFNLSQRLTVNVKDFISCITLNSFGNIFKICDPFTENALCPCDVLQNPKQFARVIKYKQ